MRPLPLALLTLTLLIPVLAFAQSPIHDHETTRQMFRETGACTGLFYGREQNADLHARLSETSHFWYQQLLNYQPGFTRDDITYRLLTSEERSQIFTGERNDLYAWAVSYCRDLANYTDQYR